MYTFKFNPSTICFCGTPHMLQLQNKRTHAAAVYKFDKFALKIPSGAYCVLTARAKMYVSFAPHRTCRVHSSTMPRSSNILPNYFHVVLKQLKYLFAVAVCWSYAPTDKVGTIHRNYMLRPTWYRRVVWMQQNTNTQSELHFIQCTCTYILCVPGVFTLHFSIL